MNTNNNQTIIKKTDETTSWYLIDASKYTLGRLSTKVAYILRDKNSIGYLPYQKGNNKIIIINSRNVQVTGKKSKQKVYKRHSGRPGGLKEETFEKLNKRIPNRIIEHAVKGMLPKNSLGRKIFKNLKIYETHKHPHTPQKLIELNID
uniref:Large ribosomal subunit protein uL13c n=1 Tax=Polysiphonia scopulorum TaxID=257860 RepID=A0A1Z1MIH6_9FLOR|nr:ribosomal protein L13 [Polysiphonia scopulorum]ARW65652.1 ribosomal protein L13 [Polysiphonia scopulorum]